MEWYLLILLFVVEALYFFGYSFQFGANGEPVPKDQMVLRFAMLALVGMWVVWMDHYFVGFMTHGAMSWNTALYTFTYQLITQLTMVALALIGAPVGRRTRELGRQYLCIGDD